MNPANAYRRRESPELAVDAIINRQSVDSNEPNDVEVARQYSQQITLRELFALTTLVAVCCAFFVHFRSDGAVFVAMVLGGNLFGVAVGWMVTHLWRMPNDGSAPVYDEDRRT